MGLDATDSINIMAPIEITAARLLSSSISPEDATSVYNSGTTYAQGNQVHSPTTHRVYESLQNSNTNHDPTLPENQVDANGDGTWWLDLGPTNGYAMFDGLVSTASKASGTSLSFTLKPGAFNGFALFGIDADHIEIEAVPASGGDPYFSYSGDLEGSAPPDYYEYFYDPFIPQTQMIQTGLMPYASAEITFTLTKVSGNPSLGMLAIGQFTPLGAPLRGATVEPVDYSYISANQFGITKVKKRYNATGLTISGKSSVENASSVLDTVKKLLGIPCVVIGSTKANYAGMTVFGLLSARMVYGPENNVDEVILNATVKGLV